MTKILIIGGTGTISTPITALCAKRSDFDVTVLNRGHKNHDLPENVKVLQADIRSEGIGEVLKDQTFDVVLDFILFTLKEAESRVRLFKGKIKQYVFISTVCALDHEETLLIDETTPLYNKRSDYGKEKATIEVYFRELFKAGGFPVTIVRPAQTYSNERIPLSVKGNGCWPVVLRMIQGKEVLVHGDGQSVWASTHADDFATAFVPLINNPKALGEIYQITNAQPHTWDKVYQILAKELGVEYKPVYIPTDLLKKVKKYRFDQSIDGDKRWSCIYDISKIREMAADWEITIPIEEGLKRYLAYMEAHPEKKVEEPEFDKWCDDTIALLHKLEKAFADEVD
ncbi:MAG: NAD-dependent epimerase/dehydratase family protein [Erysipelotrichaceae bacterium]|jgi:nucleoside-diphosphate-sugar epimerase|nr:NAD-dependent epimerase/dehydratase family protein [Erysipelotrichaceae bacterium]